MTKDDLRDLVARLRFTHEPDTRFAGMDLPEVAGVAADVIEDTIGGLDAEASEV